MFCSIGQNEIVNFYYWEIRKERNKEKKTFIDDDPRKINTDRPGGRQLRMQLR